MDDIEAQLERDKLLIEARKLRLEWFKAWTGIPLFAIAATIGVAIWTHYQKASDDFALKAAELVLNTTSPSGAANKAAVLKSLFPERLPGNFADSFKPEKIPYPVNLGDLPPTRAELFALLSSKAKSNAEVVSLVQAVYPTSPVIQSIQKEQPRDVPGKQSERRLQGPKPTDSWCDPNKPYCPPEKH